MDECLAGKLKSLLKKKGVTQAEVARQLGVSTVAVTKWVNQGTISRENLGKLAKILSVSVESLIDGKARPRQLNKVFKSIPVLTWAHVEAGKLTEMGSTDVLEYIPVTDDIPDTCFAVPVEGDSMTSRTGGESIPAGSIVIVEPCCFSRELNHQVVIATLGDLATMKELVIDGDDIYLKPWNTAYPMKPIKIDQEGYAIIGRVICYQMRVGRGKK